MSLILRPQRLRGQSALRIARIFISLCTTYPLRFVSYRTWAVAAERLSRFSPALTLTLFFLARSSLARFPISGVPWSLFSFVLLFFIFYTFFFFRQKMALWRLYELPISLVPLVRLEPHFVLGPGLAWAWPRHTKTEPPNREKRSKNNPLFKRPRLPPKPSSLKSGSTRRGARRKTPYVRTLL